MTTLTNYLADFELTALVIPHRHTDCPCWPEPLWLKGGDKSGLALFVSALDAEIYHQASDKVDITRQPVELRNQQFCARLAARIHRGAQLRPFGGRIHALAGFGHDEFADHHPGAAVDVTGDRLLLGLQTQAGSALLLRDDAIVSDIFSVDIIPLD